MIYYFNSKNSTASLKMHCYFKDMILSSHKPSQPIIILCIGSDRSTGDSLGPVIGYKLNKYNLKYFHIYGCLNQPVHAANLKNYIDWINKIYKNPFIIAIDASLGKKEHIGFITLGNGPLKPGTGVKKKLPKVGNIHITGIVNNSDTTDNLLLQTTRLATIMSLADIISNVIINVHHDLSENTNCVPYIPQQPVQLNPHLMFS